MSPYPLEDKTNESKTIRFQIISCDDEEPRRVLNPGDLGYAEIYQVSQQTSQVFDLPRIPPNVTEYNVQMERRRIESLRIYNQLLSENRFINCTPEELEDLLEETNSEGTAAYIQMLIARTL